MTKLNRVIYSVMNEESETFTIMIDGKSTKNVEDLVIEEALRKGITVAAYRKI